MAEFPKLGDILKQVMLKQKHLIIKDNTVIGIMHLVNIVEIAFVVPIIKSKGYEFDIFENIEKYNYEKFNKLISKNGWSNEK